DLTTHTSGEMRARGDPRCTRAHVGGFLERFANGERSARRKRPETAFRTGGYEPREGLFGKSQEPLRAPPALRAVVGRRVQAYKARLDNRRLEVRRAHDVLDRLDLP